MNSDKKVAIVTGGTGGIGGAVCEALLRRGMIVYIFDINPGVAVKEMMGEFGEENITFIKLDVGNIKEWEGALTKIKNKEGQIDVLCNLAGILDESDWGGTLKVNVIGVMNGTFLVQKLMSKENGGHGGVIINMGSVVGLSPAGLVPAYSASKAAVIALSQAVGDAYHFGRHGVRVNCMCPGAVDTNLMKPKDHQVIDPPMFWQIFEGTPALQPTEVASSILSLIEDETKNGVVLTQMQGEGPKEHKFDQIANV